MPPKTPQKNKRSEADESGQADIPPSSAKRPYQAPKITTRSLFERLALSCEHAVDPDTGELIVDGPS